MHDYTINPQFAITQPSPTVIATSEVTVAFEDGTTVVFGAETFNIPAPLAPTWYYVTINRSTRVGTCETSHDLAGAEGHIYLGAIQAIPSGGSINALAGGWPAPQTYLVGE